MNTKQVSSPGASALTWLYYVALLDHLLQAAHEQYSVSAIHHYAVTKQASKTREGTISCVVALLHPFSNFPDTQSAWCVQCPRSEEKPQCSLPNFRLPWVIFRVMLAALIVARPLIQELLLWHA